MNALYTGIATVRNVLMIAYHFPPAAIGSGHLRTLALARYLPRFGWEPTVLSAHPRAYSQRDDRLIADVPESVAVTRAFALDTRKHFGFRGSYPLLLAQPDRWASWWPGAVTAGLWLIRRDRPRVLWSSYPIATAHLIAYTLHRLTGVPWVADFRDPVNNVEVGDSTMTARTRQWIERRAITYATRSVFTTSGAMEDYAGRYPRCEESLEVIPNGYDERDFEALRDAQTAETVNRAETITLVHSGALYTEGRNPRAFLAAIASLRGKGEKNVESLRVILRASEQEAVWRAIVSEMGLDHIVSLQPPVPYHEALLEMAHADGLLLFQGSRYNRQIPAKVYEYLRVARPILALTDPAGDTGALLASEGINSIAPLDDASAIEVALREFLARLKEHNVVVPTPERVARYSREAGVQRFAEVFDQLVAGAV